MIDVQKVGLVVLDGWGIGTDPERDAIASAATPFFDRLRREYPNAILTTHSNSVGLPEGQMGNSEVGHLHIGAGRVVWQELERVQRAIDRGSILEQTAFSQALARAIREERPMHLIGLVSDGGVHAHIDHLIGLCDLAIAAGVRQIFIHAFTDGRDTGPRTGKGFIQRLFDYSGRNPQVHIASIIGRYYAMDRDQRWERTRRAYDLLVHGTGKKASHPIAAMDEAYTSGLTDEFIEPICMTNADGGIQKRIGTGDVVIFFNFRTDRPRQLTAALCQRSFPEYGMEPLAIKMVTMTEYDRRFEGVDVIFTNDHLKGTLGEVIAAAGCSQLRIAETEKYPHVTYFFSGGREMPFSRENRILVSSPKVATYDLQPEMSAPELTDRLLEAIEFDRPEFFCLNYANADMVGHTGDMQAAMKAATAVDACLARWILKALDAGYELIIIADHGNADCMLQDDGTPHTAHTLNPVPVIYVGKRFAGYQMRDGFLTDIAPTICFLMGIPASEEMTGHILLFAS